MLRSVSVGMLLMWDRGLHSYAMVQATLIQKSDYLGRIPKNVKFPVQQVLSDGSYLSWIAPDVPHSAHLIIQYPWVKGYWYK